LAQRTLYFAPGSSSMAPHIALHEIGCPFEARPMSFRAGELRKPDYLAIIAEGDALKPDRASLANLFALTARCWRGRDDERFCGKEPAYAAATPTPASLSQSRIFCLGMAPTFIEAIWPPRNSIMVGMPRTP